MRPSPFVNPEMRRIDLAEGDYLIVRRRLNAGETRAAFVRMSFLTPDGSRRIDWMQYGPTLAAAYLLDWSFADKEGLPVVIRGLTPEQVTPVLDNLDPLDFGEVRDAIEAHHEAAEAAAAAEKKTRSGSPPPAVILPSPPAAAGVSSGFAS